MWGSNGYQEAVANRRDSPGEGRDEGVARRLGGKDPQAAADACMQDIRRHAALCFLFSKKVNEWRQLFFVGAFDFWKFCILVFFFIKSRF